MIESDHEYWPFPLKEIEKEDPEMIDGVKFLEAVTKAGFRGYRFGITNFGVESSTCNGVIICRIPGRKWEIMLGRDNKSCLNAYVSNFSKAADAVLHWLQGESTEQILDEIEDILTTIGKSQKRYRLYGD